MAHVNGMSKDKKKSEDDKVLKTFDMYSYFSRWDVLLMMAFMIGFLIFTMALFLLPQAA